MRNKFRKWPHLLSWLLAVFIFWTCVRPVMTLTILNQPLQLFLFFFIPLLLLSIGAPFWLAGLAGILQTGWAIHNYFFNDLPLLDSQWLVRTVRELNRNARMVWQGNLTGMSDLFSAFLFYVLLWLICVVVWRWLKTGRLYLYFFLSVAAISMVDTFTDVKAAQSLPFVIVAGLLMVGIENYSRLDEAAGPAVNRTGFIKWLLIVTASLFLILATGFAGPKMDPRWTSPLVYLQNKGLISGGLLTSQRIGYDSDDTRLGGSLGMDATVLFTARISGDAGYWRVATKHIYTGKGWSAGKSGYFVPLVDRTQNLNRIALYGKNTKTTKQSARLTFTNDSPAILPYIGQPASVAASNPTLKINPDAGQVLTADEKPVRTETISYLQPVYQIPSLRRVKGSPDPESIRSRYLQLPGELPDRVRTLARKLTAKSTNRYDAVMAVMNYLKSPRFSYSTDQVPRPAGNQDYVDQFLFTSRTGYCDNFSTSMVVLLRSAGIPARWVKGFTSGEYTGQTEARVNGKTVPASIYQVKNSDAHSWADVYFPGSGWVSFDPTPTFADPSVFTETGSSGSSSPASGRTPRTPGASSSTSSAQAASRSNRTPAQSMAPDSGSVPQKSPFSDHSGKQAAAGHVSLLPRLLSVAAGILVPAVLLVAFLTRKSWLSRLLSRRLTRLAVTDGVSFNRAYARVLSLLRLNGMRRKDSQTLREFAEEVDGKISGRAMQELTQRYEQLIYSDQAGLSRADQSAIMTNLRLIAAKLADAPKKS
ncbi:transglutaminase TgpA family protein [Sporolactobacillus vineae]|uniref:transglutaminase TgpA family protein n=1 Tax=Sporolactobacillus vineae TaxID=444463 RepID=UPI000289A752|nr:transglutaminase domain-containing protein [Sporolactobacillus vineae]